MFESVSHRSTRRSSALPAALIVAGGLAIAGFAIKGCGERELADRGNAVLSLAEAAPPPPAPPAVHASVLTPAELAAFATQFVQVMSPCDPVKLEALIDFDRMFESLDARNDLHDLRGAFGASLCGGSGGTLQVAHLRTLEKGGEPELVFRLLVDELGINYLRVRVARTAAGARAVDLMSFTSGQWMGASAREMLTAIEATGDKRAQLAVIEDINRLAAAKQYRAALAKLHALAEPVRATREMVVRELHIVAEIDHARYVALLERDAQRYPDASFDLLRLLDLLVRDRLAEALPIFDRVQAVVQDPYLDALRSTTHGELGHRAEAIAAAERAVSGEPTLQAAWWALATAQAAAKRDADALATLATLHARFGADISRATLRRDPRFRALAARMRT